MFGTLDDGGVVEMGAFVELGWGVSIRVFFELGWGSKYFIVYDVPGSYQVPPWLSITGNRRRDMLTAHLFVLPSTYLMFVILMFEIF